jgi:hypothetical protein
MIIRQEFRNRKEAYFTGITLGRDDTASVGFYATYGMKVSTILKRYGRTGLLNLLSHYDLEDDILDEYHIHKSACQ